MHESPSSGINYYCLIQVDFNGSYEYSPIISTSMDSDGDFMVQQVVKR